MIVVDTHIFFWYCSGDPNLKPRLRDILERDSANVFVPSVCVWELMLLSGRGRIILGSGNPEAEIKRGLSLSGFNEAPLTNEIALLSRALPFNHNDPVDRFIAATAHAYGARLATADERLRSLEWVNLA